MLKACPITFVGRRGIYNLIQIFLQIYMDEGGFLLWIQIKSQFHKRIRKTIHITLNLVAYLLTSRNKAEDFAFRCCLIFIGLMWILKHFNYHTHCKRRGCWKVLSLSQKGSQNKSHLIKLRKVLPLSINKWTDLQANAFI